MYKRASKNMQHAHRVDTIDPGKAYIAGVDTSSDVLPSPETMTTEQLHDESVRLSTEIKRYQVAVNEAIRSSKWKTKLEIVRIKTVLENRQREIKAMIKKRNYANYGVYMVELRKLIEAEIGKERWLEIDQQAKVKAGL